jgi:formylglycine-generating enzyme
MTRSVNPRGVKRPASKILTAAFVAGAVMIGLAGARLVRHRDDGSGAEPKGITVGDSPCGEGFHRRGARCCPTDDPLAKLGDGLCATGTPSKTCPEPLVTTLTGCDTPERSVVRVPATSVVIGPSDWEAEGRVKPRTVHAGPFDIDRFEVTIGHMRCAKCPEAIAARFKGRDVARAASYVDHSEARTICAARGGRLPREDEWIVAAAGAKPSRYPWGDTGAVCRRAAWGLVRGPCGNGATGPDTVGSHPDGVTPLGIHDLAGNVEEWVEAGEQHCDAGPCLGVVRGGSYHTDLATELRTWVRREVPVETRESGIGFRCAYDVGALDSTTP